MKPEIQKIYNLLQGDSKKFIKIKVENTNEQLKRPNVDTKPKYPSYIFLEDINTTGMDLTTFLNSLVKQFNSPLHIELRRSHGTTSKAVKEFTSIIRYLLPDTTPSTAQNTSQMDQVNSQPQQPAPQQPAPYSGYDSYGQNSAAVAGMNAQTMFIADLQTKANESNRNLKDYMKECEKTLELQNKINQLTAENLELKTFKATAEEKMEFARLKAELNTKGFTDSEAFKEMIQMFPGLILSMKGGDSGQAPQPVGMNAANLSEVKQSLIAHIANPKLQDQIVSLLDRAAGGLLQLPAFNEEFNNLLNTHNL